LPIGLDPRDRDGWQARALRRRRKCVRKLHGRLRRRVQPVQEDLPPRKEWQIAGEDISGLGTGPSTIAIVSEDIASRETFSSVDGGRGGGDRTNPAYHGSLRPGGATGGV
jgi:hypothetical protein